MKNKKHIIIAVIVVVVVLVALYLVKQKSKKDAKQVSLPVFDSNNPVPVSDSSDIQNQSSIVYEECGGILGFYDCFPLKKGMKDNDSSDWIKSLQRYLGLEQDGFFGENTEKAVEEAVNSKTVEWYQYAAIKEAFCRLNPDECNMSTTTIKGA